MLSNFLIGLREGLEASLIVGILVAYLVRTERQDRLRAVWGGVVAAVVLSVGFVLVLDATSNSLSDRAAEIFAGITSLVAVVLVTWMVFWMRRAARGLASELHGKMDAAMAIGPVALGLTAFVAVAREGLETALFLWTNAKSSGDSATPFLGGVLGLAVAVVLGWLLYRKAVTINLSTFFAWTGAALIVLAAGVLAYGVHELQEAGVLALGTATAYDITSWYDESSWYGSLLKGIFHFNADPTVLEVLAWATYLVVTMTAFVRGLRPSAPSTAAVPSTEAPTDGGTVAEGDVTTDPTPVG